MDNVKLNDPLQGLLEGFWLQELFAFVIDV